MNRFIKNVITVSLCLTAFVNIAVGNNSSNNAITASADGIVYVDADGSGDGSSWAQAAPSLSEALKTAAENAGQIRAIYIAEGTYHPEYQVAGSSDPRWRSFILPTGVLVRGGYDAATGLNDPDLHETILSGDFNNTHQDKDDDAYHVVIAAADANSHFNLENLTIALGNATSEDKGSEAPSVMVNGKEIRSVNGGGAYIVSATADFKNLIFLNNQGNNGGALFNNGVLNLSDSKFMANVAANTGGGLYGYYDSESRLQNVDFESNYASGEGGGVFIDESGYFEMDFGNFSNNYTASAGGGLDGIGAHLSVSHCIFDSNSSYTGGAIYTTAYNDAGSSVECTTHFKNCLFVGNTTTGPGGVIAFDAEDESLDGFSFINCTFAGSNSSESNEGHLFALSGNHNPQGEPFRVTNCILESNPDSESFFYGVNNAYTIDEIVFRYVLSEYQTGSLGSHRETANNIENQSAGFVAGQNSASPDYRLDLGSPAINAGSIILYFADSDFSEVSNSKDLAGQTRMNGANIDLGAYESGLLVLLGETDSNGLSLHPERHNITNTGYAYTVRHPMRNTDGSVRTATAVPVETVTGNPNDLKIALTGCSGVASGDLAVFDAPVIVLANGQKAIDIDAETVFRAATSDVQNACFITIDEKIILKPGCEFRFEIRSNKGYDFSGECAFRILATPDAVVWTGAQNDDWNNDLNWFPDDPTLSGSAFAPLPETRVIMPEGLSNYPILNNNNLVSADIENHPSEVLPDITHTPYIEYDAGFSANSCMSISFENGSELGNQFWLNYDSADVELNLKTWEWHALSAPLHNIYSGDFALPWANPIVSMQLHDTKNPATGACYSDWSGTFNTTTVPLTAGKGFVVRVSNRYYTDAAFKDPDNKDLGIKELGKNVSDIDEVTYHFPRTNTVFPFYHLYWHSLLPQTETVGEHGRDLAHRFAYEPTDGASIPEGDILATLSLEENPDPALRVDGGTVVVGNPLMSHFDFNKFYEANRAIIENEYKILVSDDDGRGLHYVSTVSDKDSRRSISTASGENTSSIAPMQSFIITLKKQADGGIDRTQSSTLNLTLPKTASITANRLRSEILRSSSESVKPATLRISASRDGLSTTAVVAIRNSASENFSPDEDSRLMLLASGSQMPVVFTEIENAWLDINQTPCLPDTLHIGINDAGRGLTTISFAGVETLVSSDRLMFADLLTGFASPLEEGFEYVFENDSEENTITNRFAIIKQPLADDDPATVFQLQNNLRVWASSGAIHIETTNPTEIRIIAVSGNIISQKQISGRADIPVSAGVYIVSAGEEKRKVVVR